MVKKFITYGDNKYLKSRKRLVNEVKSLNLFDEYYDECENIINDKEIKEALKNEDFKNVFNKKRGGGYWIWKPYIIYKNLLKLNNNDILVYTDAGSMIYKKKSKSIDRFNYLFNFVNNYQKGLIAINQKYIESQWTKGDIFDYFSFRNNKKIYNSTQYAAGAIHVIRKCNFSMNLYKEWWDIAKNKAFFFDDSPSLNKNYDNFLENRHDQSVWSLLCKKYNIKRFSDLYHNPFINKRIKDKI